MAATKIWQAIGYKLLNTTAITDIVGDRCFHGRRPADDTDFPCINYFMIGNPILGEGSAEAPTYQISCRATDPETAQELAQGVALIFHKMRETVDGFDILCGTVENMIMIDEPDNDVYHIPVTIRVVVRSIDN